MAALIEEFKQGYLPLKEGMSLRCFLAKMVYCNPKRISKKVGYDLSADVFLIFELKETLIAIFFCPSFQFEGSNYNGKQLYEQNDKELDPKEAEARRTKLQQLEDKFEDSIKAMKKVEELNYVGTDHPQANAIGDHSQPPRAGFPGQRFLREDTSMLRDCLSRSMAPPGAGVSSFPSVASAFDPALFPGYMNPLPSIGINARALNGSGRLLEYGRFPVAGDTLFGSGGHCIHSPSGGFRSFDTLANIGYASASADILGALQQASLGVRGGLTFPTSSNNASVNVSFETISFVCYLGSDSP